MDDQCYIVQNLIAIVQRERMDPLSEILSLLKPGSYGFRGLNAGGRWAFAFPAAEGMKCYAIWSGECWIAIDGPEKPTRLAAGDFVLVPGRSPFRLYSAADAPAIDPAQFFPSIPAGGTAVLNGGGDCSGVGGFFGFEGPHAKMLLGVLPPLVHIRADTTKASLSWLIERLMGELREPKPGGALIAGHLAQTLLIEALRLHLVDSSPQRSGWLSALADPKMSNALVAMHEEPGRRWTLEALARHVGMSRSSFAVRFKDTVGESAMDYLTRWRMIVAADRLATTGASIAAVTSAAGYESESAFGAAFKRVIGRSPRKFARAA